MTAGSIRVLKPNVSQEDALRAFSAVGFSALYWRIRSGPLRRIADVYVQYFLFRVKCEDVPPRLFAIDAVEGSLDLFEFPRIPDEREFLATGFLREKVLRVIFQQGFFKVRNTHLEISLVPFELHLPYWLGFYGRKEMVRCRVLDAVRRRMEGAKASAFFEQWLAA